MTGHCDPQPGRSRPASSCRAGGFTLIEVILAVSIVLVASTMIYVTFSTVAKAWRNGTRLAEDLHHGDFVADQLVMALRSAYFPDARGTVSGYGFLLEDGGSGESASDAISWVKQGTALTESNSATVAGPHRIRFSVEMDEDQTAAAVRYWRPFALPDDFDPMQIEPQFISRRVIGFDCMVATNTVDGEWEWSDEWEKDNTNRLPRAVRLTVYLAPIEEDRPAVEMTRCVEIPVWRASWGGTPLADNTPIRSSFTNFPGRPGSGVSLPVVPVPSPQGGSGMPPQTPMMPVKPTWPGGMRPQPNQPSAIPMP